MIDEQFKEQINKMLKSKPATILGTLFLAVIAIYYIRNQYINFISAPLDFEIAVAVTASESVETDCYIIRDEIIMTTEHNGIMVPAVKDGGRVSKDAPALTVYFSSSDVDIKNQIREIDDRIAVLEKSKTNSSTADTKPQRINDEIEFLLDDAVSAIASNDLVDAINVRDDLLVQMNKKGLYSANPSDFKAQIDKLKSEKRSLEQTIAGKGKIVSASSAGYYYSDVDGYENIFLAKSLPSMSIESFDVMINTPPITYNGNVCGKLVIDHRWYAACKVSANEARHFDVGKEYNVEFVSSNATCVKMSLAYKIEENGNEKVVLVFEASSLPEKFDYIRKQPIRLVYNTYSGLKIPKDTIRVVDGVKGVYVTGGTTVRFKMIQEVYTLDDYYIVEADKDKYPTVEKSKTISDSGEEVINYHSAISLYDRVIVGEDDLFDGMELK